MLWIVILKHRERQRKSHDLAADVTVGRRLAERTGSAGGRSERLVFVGGLLSDGTKRLFFASGRREYIVFSNSGAVQEEFNQRKLLNLQKKVQEEKKISLNVGIGIGGTMNDAEMNARRALDFSLKNAKQEIFWIDAGQTQHGPLGKEIQLEYQLISSDPKLQEISEKTGLSTTSILKIIAIADVRKSYIFDAHQLAECLGITVRSARRIMNKIMEAGYGKVYAKKTAAAGGRPKALVEILFKI
mgnify:CR=1 FL=1